MLTQKRIGLARALSKQGYCSRSQAASLISAGRVALNGRISKDPECPVRILRDRIEIDGASLDKAPAIYLMMNKPRGVVTTASDEKCRKTVYDLLEPGLPWVGPVGRLDKASEGLLLLTKDSEWAAKITDPVSHLDKKYHVQVNCIADVALLASISRAGDIVWKGMSDAQSLGQLRESLHAKAASILRHGEKNSWLEITLDEGKNRHIRRMLETLNVEVLRLIRVSMGPLELGELKKGAARHLTSWEKKALDQTLLTVSSRAKRGTDPYSQHTFSRE